MKCEADCGHLAELKVWTDTWAYDGGMILNLCLECAGEFFKVRYKQECRELGVPHNPDEMLTVCCPNCEIWHVLPPRTGKIIPRYREGEPMTVGDLATMLIRLPRDIPIVETYATYTGRVVLGSDTIQVFEKDGRTELHFDDGAAYHNSLDPHRQSIFHWYREGLQ